MYSLTTPVCNLPVRYLSAEPFQRPRQNHWRKADVSGRTLEQRRERNGIFRRRDTAYDTSAAARGNRASPAEVTTYRMRVSPACALRRNPTARDREHCEHSSVENEYSTHQQDSGCPSTHHSQRARRSKSLLC